MTSSRPGRWKRWLSYLWPVPIASATSKYSGVLTVYFHRGTWRLETQEAVYSFGKHYPPFLAGIKYSDYPRPGASVLLLGLGTGSAVEILQKAGHTYNISAVDIDPVIIQLAQKYIQIPADWKINYTCEDAVKWIEHTHERYDLIFADIFLHNTTPEHVQKSEFLEKLKMLLTPGGWLLFSKLNDNATARTENILFENKMVEIFPGYHSIDTDGNRVYAWQRD